MNRFTRVLMVAMMAIVLSAAVAAVSSADTGKSGTTVSIKRQQMQTLGQLRPVTQLDAQGKSGDFFGQYFDYNRFFDYLYWYSKVSFLN